MMVKEALASWKGKVVKAAMDEEIRSLIDMGTWELVERSPGVNIMKNRPHAPRPPGLSVPAATTAATASATAATAAATAATAAPACCTAMDSLRVLAFDHEGRPVQFDTWLDDLQLYLLSDSKDSVLLCDLPSGAAPTPSAIADRATLPQLLIRDAAARLAIRNHLLLAECAHFGQHRTAQALYDAVIACYSSPPTAALGRLLLPYLFPELSAFTTVEDLVSHLRTSDARYRATVPDDAIAVGAARGTPRPPFFEGCSPSPLAPSYASAAAADVPGAEDVGAGSASAKRHSGNGKGSKGGGGGSGSGGGGGGGSGGSGGGSGGVGGGGGGSSGSGGSGGVGTGAWRGGPSSGQRQQQQRRSEIKSPQQLRDAEGDYYRCLPPDSGIAAAALGGSESSTLPGLHLPSFSTNLVSTAALQDAMVTTTTPGGQRVSICTCTRTGRHLATFTRRPGSSLYTLATEPPQVAASAQVSASGQIVASCSCRLLSHQNLLWHHCLGHPSLPRFRGMHSRLLVSGLPSLRHWTVVDVLILWIRKVRLQLRERFGQDLLVLRLHCDRVGEFSSNLLRDFCLGEGILESFMLPDFPRQNGIAERRIGLALELILWPCVSVPETSPTLHWTGEVGDASVFRVWGSRAFLCDTSVDKLYARAIPCVFLGFVLDAPGWQFYHPTSRRVLLSQDVMLDESVPFYRLFPYRSAPPPPPPLFLAPGPPPIDPLPPHGLAPSDVYQWLVRRARLRSGAPGAGGTGDAGAGGVGVIAGAGGLRGTAAAGPGGARTRDTRAAGTGGVGGTGAGDPTKPGAAGAGGSSAGGAGTGGAGAGGAGVGGPGTGGAGAAGARAVDPGAGSAGGTVRPRPSVVAGVTASLPSACSLSLHSMESSAASLRSPLSASQVARHTEDYTCGSWVCSCYTDPSLFLRTDTFLQLFYVLVYVNNLVFATADAEALTLVKSELQKRHTCTDVGELHSYLGLQITRDRARRTITLTQSHRVHQVLQRFGFQFSLPQPTPLSTSHSLSDPPSDESVEPSGPYPERVGCLMYLTTCTRPDLAYPLGLLTCHVTPGRHRKVHWDAAKRVLRYLCSTSGSGLMLGGRGPVVLTNHTHAS
ncbi:unnamed protein product [Closterium sp. NIES-54]